MGVDAQMLVRGVKSTTVTDEWLKLMSWRLAQSIGADMFYGWNAQNTAIYRTKDYGDEAAPGTSYFQDGETIPAEPGECLLEIALGGRYYGIGYERGPIITYCAIAEWLEYNIPNCVVYYGGDSSGVCAELFNEKARIRLRQHLYGTDGRAYFNYPSMGDKCAVRPPACARCPKGQYCGSQFGYGNSYAAFSCAGCGDKAFTRDGGETWKKEDTQ